MAKSRFFAWAVGFVLVGSGCSQGEQIGEGVDSSRAGLVEDWQLCGDAFSYYDEKVYPATEVCQPLKNDPGSLWGKIYDALDKNSRPWINRSSDPPMMDGEITLRIRFGDAVPRTTVELEELFAQHERIVTFIGKQKDPSSSKLATREEFLRVLNDLRDDIEGEAAELADSSKARTKSLRNMVLAKGSGGQMQTLLTQLNALADVEEVLDDTEASLSSLVAPASAVIAQFSGLKGKQAALEAAAQDLSTRASNTTIATLPALQVELATWNDTQGVPASELLVEAARVEGHFAATLHDFQSRVDGLKDLVELGAVTVPALDETALTTHAGIVGYATAWEAYVNETFEQLQSGLKLRLEALVKAAADEATRSTFAKTQHLKAAQEFLAMANAESTQLLSLPPKSVTLKALLLTTKFDELTATLQLEPLCIADNLATESWRESGCVALRRDFARARTFLEKTIPALLRSDVAILRRAGVPTDQLAAIETELSAGRVRAAVALSDAAILSVDTLPPPVLAPLPAPAPIAAKALPPPPPSESLGTVRSAETKECAARRCEVIGDICAARERLLKYSQYLDVVSAQEQALSGLVEDLSSLLTKPLEKIKNAAFKKVLDAHPDVNAYVRESLYDLFVGLRKSSERLTADVKAAQKDLNEQGQRLVALSSSIAGLPGLDPSKAGIFELVAGQAVPDIVVPGVPVAAPVEGNGAAYVRYADGLLTRIAGKASDRVGLAGELSSWQQNSAQLRGFIGVRAASHPTEARELATANGRVVSQTKPQVSSKGWFVDTGVSADARARVDKVFSAVAPLATRPLHDALSAWSATLSPSERRDVEAVVTSLARASGEASLLGRSGNKARIGSLLAQLAVAVRPGKLVVSPGSLADLAKVLNGRELGGQGRSVSLAEQLRLGAALGLSPELWRAFSHSSRSRAAGQLAQR
jgi:hypothetical protein